MTTTTRASRRPTTVVLVALVVYLAVLGVFALSLVTMLDSTAGGGAGLFGARVAIVELDGIIVDVDGILQELRAYRESPAIRAIVIRINSPGGVVAPTQELHDALKRVRAAGKPVVASLGSVAASGGYYAAVAADRIYASPGSLTGSIGVIMQLANLEALMKKVGVDYVVVKAGQFKDVGNFSRAMTPEERRVLQSLLDDVHGQFVDAVAAGRKLDRGEVLRFADGRVFSGAQAKQLRMVDALGGLEAAIDAAATLAGLPAPPRTVGPRRRFSLVDLIRNELGLGGLESLGSHLPLFKTPLYLMD